MNTHPLDNISSASSSTNSLIVLARRARRVIISYTRPGVPTTTWTPLSNWRISSRTFVPPMQAWHLAFKWSPSAITTLNQNIILNSCVSYQIEQKGVKLKSQSHTFWICWANSLVGAKMSAWHSRMLVSICWRIEIENVAVFPVPDWACAITSRPWIQGIIARCWIAEGFSKP